MLALFVLLLVNSVYLLGVTVAGPAYQNWFYLNMFLLHLVLGLAIVVPTIAFGLRHLRNTRHRKNRRAVRVGYALFGAALLLFATGIVLTRVDIFGFRLELDQPLIRSVAYGLHVLCPVAAIWLYIIHRLAGPRIRWRLGFAGLAFATASVVGMLIWQAQDPRDWNIAGPDSGVRYFFPSLARTRTGDFIPARTLQNDDYCKECHEDVHARWSQSAHKFSSFNNPVYTFSVKQTRAALSQRDGHARGSRFCAGCHDPVPFFSGAFDDPKFDDPNYDLANDEMAQAGITCTVCHAISHINSPMGNADYTIEEPIHYPFAFSERPFLKWVNRQLVKAKPAFHKTTFLKPLHRQPEFCGSCHKVHLPEELNHYKWLRGQNHYDSYWLSGVSGYGVASFYYPHKAESNCNGCHMPLREVGPGLQFAARVRDESAQRKTVDHLFPSANTALPALLPEQFADPKATIAEHARFLESVMRVDLFGLREGGAIDGALTAPLRPNLPALQAGRTYLLETVIRTLKMGHHFTQGTVDSNEVWLELKVTSNGRLIGHSGGIDALGEVDPFSHFVNGFVIDRAGNRIDRRNAEDIFVSVYDHQIPPGAAAVVHYLLKVPPGHKDDLQIEVTLYYRKFDATIMRYVMNDALYVNRLPVMKLAEDKLVLRVGESQTGVAVGAFPEWQRWNDYGIGLLLEPQNGELRQARQAFEQVEALGTADGPLNLARVYLREGLVQTDAPRALDRAHKMGANPWSVLWFGALVAEANGDYETVIANLEAIMAGKFKQLESRGFDFSRDYRLLNLLGSALFQRGLTQSGVERKLTMDKAKGCFFRTLALDPENLTAQWGLYLIYRDLGVEDQAEAHRALHARYKHDDNARDTAVAAARQKYPAANRAAEAVVIYELDRPETYRRVEERP